MKGPTRLPQVLGSDTPKINPITETLHGKPLHCCLSDSIIS
jgi:hypothetical protein